MVSCATTVHRPFRADAVPIAEGDIDKPFRLSKKNSREPAAQAPPTNLTSASFPYEKGLRIHEHGCGKDLNRLVSHEVPESPLVPIARHRERIGAVG